MPVGSAREILDVFRAGLDFRAAHERKLNANSARSHTLFSVTVAQKDKLSPDGPVKSGVFHLADLAGSERFARCPSEGRRFEEVSAYVKLKIANYLLCILQQYMHENLILSFQARVIASGLATLERVLTTLAAGRPADLRHSESKLTHILSSALSPSAYTSLIAAVNPDTDSYEETLATLQFAQRVATAGNHNCSPDVGGVRDPASTTQGKQVKNKATCFILPQNRIFENRKRMLWKFQTGGFRGCWWR